VQLLLTEPAACHQTKFVTLLVTVSVFLSGV